MNLISLILLLIIHPLKQQEPSLSEVRKLYFRSDGDKNSAYSLSLLLLTIDTNSTPTLVCYKGASIMMNARFTINPFNKFSAFRKGRLFIESAIKHSGSNVETHFIRFCIQSNLPGFLAYNQDLNADKKILINGISSLDSPELRTSMVCYLSKNRYFSKEEIKKLR